MAKWSPNWDKRSKIDDEVKSDLTLSTFKVRLPQPKKKIQDFLSSFLHFKKGLREQQLENDKKLKTAEVKRLNFQAANFYTEGLSKLVQRQEKCLEFNCYYMEKRNRIKVN